ncbi:PH domain-containing protein [Microbacterium sp. Ld4]|uniref:PH domain-containing protein n=1 Tax=Microbacterium sp. Ld4 TaxID=649157 RepID=UPI00386B5A47
MSTAPPQTRVRSGLADGEWHRMHPLSPLLRGGLTLLVVLGILIANLRDRIIGWFLPSDVYYDEGNPVDILVENDFVVPAILAVLGVIIVVIVLFAVSWRFHTFRITGDDVEVRSGVLFRTHRRAPLDRVQGVNLTRPALARLVGLAKLEVVGAGLDANVRLEYLSTSNAETIRGDILRLASGRQRAEAAARREAAAPASSAASAAARRIGAGITEIVDGVDEDEVEPASIVRVPIGRLILANLLSGSTIWLIAIIIAAVIGLALQPIWLIPALGASIPAAIGFGAYTVRQFIKTVRYSIAPTSAGVRVTFGLLTTVTETLPPGRIHAVDVRQPVLWRLGGWWRIRVNRLSGRAATDTSTTQFADVLPIGTRDDVERVLRLLLPAVEVDAALLQAGLGPAAAGDGFTVSPRRARWYLPFSQPRNGFRLERAALLLRRGRIWPKLVILPLARLQSVRVDQGPIDRAFGLASVTGHTVLGPVSGAISALDHRDALTLWRGATDAAVVASSSDGDEDWDQTGDIRLAFAPEGNVDIEWGQTSPAQAAEPALAPVAEPQVRRDDTIAPAAPPTDGNPDERDRP